MGITAIGGSNVEGLPFSDAVRAGDFIFISGMVAINADGTIVSGDVAEQTDRIIADATELLRQADATFDNVVKVCVYLTPSADFDVFNQAYERHLGKVKPARVSVVANLTIDALVEMDFVAYVGP